MKVGRKSLGKHIISFLHYFVCKYTYYHVDTYGQVYTVLNYISSAPEVNLSESEIYAGFYRKAELNCRPAERQERKLPFSLSLSSFFVVALFPRKEASPKHYSPLKVLLLLLTVFFQTS